MIIDRRVIIGVAVGLGVLVVVILLVVGVREALLAAGLAGGAVGSAVLQQRVAKGKAATARTEELARRLPDIPDQTEDAARKETDKLSDAEKVAKANKLLGDE